MLIIIKMSIKSLKIKNKYYPEIYLDTCSYNKTKV